MIEKLARLRVLGDDSGAAAIAQPDAKSEPCELSIVMPCLNEAETIAVCVLRATRYLASRGIAGEVVIADNGSTDGSQRIAESLGARVVAVVERGYGSAIIGGVAAARGRYVIMGDADDSYDFSALDPFVERLRAGDELVMGNRFAGGIKPTAMPFLHRYLGNPVLSGIGRLFFRAPIGDFHCGLRGFSRAAFQRLNLTSTGMEFASEMVVKATLQNLKIAEVPTILWPDGRSRPPHLRSWRDGWRHLRFLLLFSPRWLFLYPGLALMLTGLLGMSWLSVGPRQIGGLTLDVHTLIYCGAAIVCGFQAIAFAMLASIFAVKAKLFPSNDRVALLAGNIRLEICIGAGIGLLLLGFIASVYALANWEGKSFGGLDPVVAMRVVIPAATAMMLGLQVIFSGFFVLLLQQHRQ